MTREELAQNVFTTAHLTGTFRLRSGQISQEYFDKYRFESQPVLLAAIAEHLAPLIPPGVEALAGLEMGGIPIATALSLKTGIPAAFIRKQAKDYGTCQFAEGFDVKGRRLCLIEDVITTGGQVVESCQDLRQEGAIVENVLCVIYRGSQLTNLESLGLTCRHLFTMEELKAAGARRSR